MSPPFLMNDDDIQSVSRLSIASSTYTMVEGRSNESPAPPYLATYATDHPTSPPLTHNPIIATKTATPVARQTPCLQLTLPALNDTEKDRHAIVPFPSSHEDTVNVALNVFSEYSNQLNHKNIRLRYRNCTREGIWIWADVQPSTWTFLVQPDDEVGVFPKKFPLPEVSEWSFINARISVTYGTHRGSTVNWSSAQFSIDRPRTFQEAKKVIAVLMNTPPVYIGIPRQSEEEVLKKRFRFFYFTSTRGDKYTTDHWVEFPPMAYQNDNVWRALVPGPGMIMGVMLE